MHQQSRVIQRGGEFSHVRIGIDRVDDQSGRQQVARGAQRSCSDVEGPAAERPSIETASTTSAFGVWSRQCRA